MESKAILRSAQEGESLSGNVCWIGRVCVGEDPS